MGIPSYFSYIVKNHSNIIKKLTANTIQVNNLYLDCNSIIYDAVHNIDFSKEGVYQWLENFLLSNYEDLKEYFDVLVIDEGQDLHPEWGMALLEMVKVHGIYRHRCRERSYALRRAWYPCLYW
jgi:hypothetical protein